MGASSRDTRRQGDVAIIGMACIFPGAADLQTYWQNIVSGVDAIGDPPADWGAEQYFDPDASENDRTYCKRGGYLRDLARFNPLTFGVMPSSVDGEPDQFLALRVAHEALADAGYLNRPIDRTRVGVVIGRGTYINRGFTTVVQHGLVVDRVLHILKQLHPDYRDEDLRALKQELKASLPPFNAEIAPALVPNLVSGRIANRLDFMGPNYTVDAACASSHIAIARGVDDLLEGECDLAIAGGIHASTPAPILMIFSQLGALSRSGCLRPFDRGADGTLLGEGVGLLVLKRREDAERDGDRVYALVKGIGVASDGRAVGLLAPRVEGEALALARAYERSGVSPRTVELIEAHGTGTPVGDAAEIEALQQVFGQRDGLAPWCALGSVKSMISHLIPAAGVAGIIKTALALYHRVLPPTLHCDDPDPRLRQSTSPFYVNTETRPWIHGAASPRRAGVNAFGFGGINAHAVLEEHTLGDELARPAYHRDWDAEVCVLEAASRGALVTACERLERLAQGEGRLRDVAATCNRVLANAPCRAAVVASSLGDLTQKLQYLRGRLANPACTRVRDVNGIYFFDEPLARTGDLAFVFPGEGSQYPGMLADLSVHFPQVRAWFDLIDSAFPDRPFTPSQVIFPPPGGSVGSNAEAEDRLWQMDYGAEAVFTASQAILELLGDLRITPHAVVGHSTGEYSALTASGARPVADRGLLIREIADLHTCYERFVANQGLAEGVLMAIGGARPELVDELLQRNGVYVAMDNCPHQVVVFGPVESASDIVETARHYGALCSRLPFNRAYHTPLFQAFSKTVAGFFNQLPVAPPNRRLYSCATASLYPRDADGVRALAAEQWSKPVRFKDTIEAMYAAGSRIFVEVGPRNNLTAFVDDILGRRPHLAVASNVHHRSGIAQLQHLIAQLAAHGVSMSLDALYRRRAPVDLNEIDATAQARAAERGAMPLPTGLQPMRLREGRPPSIRSAPPAVQPSTIPRLSVDGTVSERGDRADSMRLHLATMRRFVDLQQEVMHAFLAGGGVGTMPEAPPSRRESFAGGPAAVETQTPTAGRSPEPPPGQAERIVQEPRSARHELFAIVSERTGYPVEMLDPSLDLEADLGIDSIKRVEILSAFQERVQGARTINMDRLTRQRTLDAILRGLEESGTPPADGGVMPPNGGGTGLGSLDELSLVGTVTSYERNRELVAIRTLDLDEDLFLRDHTLGRAVSDIDPGLSGLPIVPLTISIEMLAQAAAALVPGRLVVAVRNIRAYQWIALDRNRIRLRIAARHSNSDPDRVEVRITSAADDSIAANVLPLVEGVVVLADQYPAAPDPDRSTLASPRASTWTADRLYSEIMFHGPCFRAVQSMDRWSEDGAEGTLVALPPNGMFRTVPAPRFLTEPVVLDAAGQVVGFWIAEGEADAYHVFPFRVEAVELYAPPLRAGSRVRCKARIQKVGESQLRSDLDMVGDDEILKCRLVGWEDKRFDLPEAFYRFRTDPRSRRLGRRWAEVETIAGREPCAAVIVDEFQREFLESHGRVWLRALGHLVLSRRERDVWADLQRPPARLVDWLLGRIAAKEAAREFLRKQSGITLMCADIEIEPDADRCPRVVKTWTADVDPPVISIAHAGGVAAAVAVDAASWRGVGLDVEPMARASGSFAAAAFSEDEDALIGTARDLGEWRLRMWCAKEAAGKAIGLGLVQGPRFAVIEEMDTETGRVSVALRGELAARAGDAAQVEAATFRDGAFVGAVVFTKGG